MPNWFLTKVENQFKWWTIQLTFSIQIQCHHIRSLRSSEKTGEATVGQLSFMKSI